MEQARIASFRDEIGKYLNTNLLPFWEHRGKDVRNGGFVTHFDQYGRDSGEDEKTLIAQTRLLYAFSTAFRCGYGKIFEDMARHAADFIINRLWDSQYEGFYWIVDRRGNVLRDEKILYGHSFAIYALAEYAMATRDDRGRFFAERVFDLILRSCADTENGGYFEMFDRKWHIATPGAGGGDRKTLDVHMHLMEAITGLYECTQAEMHRRRLLEIMGLLFRRLIDRNSATGIPQFTSDWRQAPQIKFDVVWGWDRFRPDGEKPDPFNNTSYGHNCELAWLLLHAYDVLGVPAPPEEYLRLIRRMVDHTVDYGIDWEYGGVYVEGPRSGPAHDTEKEFWQQCEVMTAMLEAYLRFRDNRYLAAYEAVHTFLFDKGINWEVGEMWPLLSRTGRPIWTHMAHSWKINYHSVRAMIQCRNRLDQILRQYPNKIATSPPAPNRPR